MTVFKNAKSSHVSRLLGNSHLLFSCPYLTLLCRQKSFNFLANHTGTAVSSGVDLKAVKKNVIRYFFLFSRNKNHFHMHVVLTYTRTTSPLLLRKDSASNLIPSNPKLLPSRLKPDKNWRLKKLIAH